MKDASSNTLALLDALVAKKRPSTRAFRTVVYSFYRRHGRSFPWRSTRDPYRIYVSEIMLQQTQTDRVVPKYRAFIKRFPTWRALANASSSDVMKEWKGLGYYRRAFNLHRAAKIIVESNRGRLPADTDAIRALPGVGSYTAGAIGAFAFGIPSPIIETNIRTVFLYTFFQQRTGVSDREIAPLIEETLDRKEPREWYYALMDLGNEIKKVRKGINARSKHHVKQSPYHGSNRQVRAMVLKVLAEKRSMSEPVLARKLRVDKERLERAVSGLLYEGLVERTRSGALALP